MSSRPLTFTKVRGGDPVALLRASPELKEDASSFQRAHPVHSRLLRCARNDRRGTGSLRLVSSKTKNKECHCESYRSRTWQSQSAVAGFARAQRILRILFNASLRLAYSKKMRLLFNELTLFTRDCFVVHSPFTKVRDFSQ